MVQTSLDIADEGLTVLNGTIAGDFAVDYVFLHGLNGHPKKTWTYESSNDSGFFWPQQVLADIPGCRVLMFGYNAAFERALVQNTTTINAIAQTLISRLIDKRQGGQINRPLILISHSLGGLVVKRTISNIHADRSSGLQTRKIKEQNAIYDSIAGLVFMGTPHLGSHVTDKTRVQILRAIAGATFKNAPENLLKALAAHSNELQDLSSSFEKTTLFTQHSIEICTYFETKTTKFAGKEEVVPRAMAILHYLNEREEPIAAEHTKMTRFPNAEDGTYQSICQRLIDMGKDGLDVLRVRQATYRISQIPSDITRLQLPSFLSGCEELQSSGQTSSLHNIQIHSFAARVGQIQHTKVATVTFKEIPRLFLREGTEWTLPFIHNTQHGTIVIDTHFEGFTALNEVRPENHVLDCIAIPGLGYHPFSVFQHNIDTSSFMWLRDSLPQLAEGTQMLLYGYDAEIQHGNYPSTIEQLAVSFISQLRSIDRSALSAKPLVFLAHSMSGIVLKQCLIELANSGQAEMFILRTVRSCIFLAVPNCFPSPGKMAAIVGHGKFNDLVSNINSNTGYISSLDEVFGGLAQIHNIRIHSGYETLPTAFSKQSAHAQTCSALLLDQQESIQRGSNKADIFPITKTHSEILELRPGSQIIEIIGRLVREEYSHLPVMSNLGPEISSGRTSYKPLSNVSTLWTSITSYLQTSRISEVSQPSTSKAEVPSKENIKSSLEYRELLSTFSLHSLFREDNIEVACTHTFDWLWSKPEIGFLDWLDDDTSLYWIRGKPGSGKSTLMRYIWNHHLLSSNLGKDSSFGPKIKTAFFFHHRGSYIQKSFEGMLHSILRRILEQEPRLASVLMPEFMGFERKQRAQWTLTRLIKAYEEILAQTTISVEIFLFLDALDEFDGPPEAIVQFIQSSVKNIPGIGTRLKVCFSSRQWSTFEESFSTCPGFEIHKHTDKDIRTYISTRLKNDEVISIRMQNGTENDQSNMREIEQRVTTRAMGVFIWVKAVADEISRGLSQGIPIAELVKRVEAIPHHLDKFYTEIIKRIPLEFRAEAFVAFEIILRSDVPLSIRNFMRSVHCAKFHSLASCVTALEITETESVTRQWIQDRGGGLMDVTGSKQVVGYVGFMHQTVHDFVTKPGFRSLILGQPFAVPMENGYTFLSKYTYACIQKRRRPYPHSQLHAHPNCFSQSELTTGRSLKHFWDALDTAPVNSMLHFAALPDYYIGNSKIAFAVICSLTILLQEIVNESNGKFSDEGEFSLLHCLLSSYELGQNIVEYDDSFSWAKYSFIEMAPWLVQHGARLDATYDGKTPFQTLFKHNYYTRFHGGAGHDFSERARANMVYQLLQAGQNPNVDISILKGRNPSIVGKPVHIASPSIILLLLEFNADVNAIDTEGHTPLDLACGVGGNIYEVGDHVRPAEIYELVVLLLNHGAKLTTAGTKIWPIFLDCLVENGITIPDHIRYPPKKHQVLPNWWIKRKLRESRWRNL